MINLEIIWDGVVGNEWDQHEIRSHALKGWEIRLIYKFLIM